MGVLLMGRWGGEGREGGRGGRGVGIVHVREVFLPYLSSVLIISVRLLTFLFPFFIFLQR